MCACSVKPPCAPRAVCESARDAATRALRLVSYAEVTSAKAIVTRFGARLWHMVQRTFERGRLEYHHVGATRAHCFDAMSSVQGLFVALRREDELGRCQRVQAEASLCTKVRCHAVPLHSHANGAQRGPA